MEQEVAKETQGQTGSLTLGIYLQKARDKKKLSIEAVSRHTRINLTNLSALESDDVERLPNIAYVRGFVKTLAKTYDLDIDEATQKLEELYGAPTIRESQNLEASDFPQAQVEKKQDLSNTQGQISDSLKYKILAAVAVVSVGIFIFINVNKSKEVATDNTEREVVVEAQVLTEDSPLSQKQEEAPTPEPKEEVVAAVTQEIKEEVKVEEKPEEKKIEEKVDKKDEEINFYNLPSPLFAFKDITEDEKNAIIPENFRNAFESDMQNVFLKASRGDSWIVYQKDDEPIKKFTLQEGRYLLIKGEKVLIRLGNIDALDVFYNGDLLGMQSRSGVKSLIFPVEVAKEYKLPLFIFNKDGTVQNSKDFIEARDKASE